MEESDGNCHKMSQIVVTCRKLSWRLSQLVVTFFSPSPSRRPLLDCADSRSKTMNLCDCNCTKRHTSSNSSFKSKHFVSVAASADCRCGKKGLKLRLKLCLTDCGCKLWKSAGENFYATEQSLNIFRDVFQGVVWNFSFHLSFHISLWNKKVSRAISFCRGAALTFCAELFLREISLSLISRTS